MNIVKVIIIIAFILLIIISAFDYFHTNESNDNNIKEKPGYEAAFAIIALLAVAILVLRGTDKKNKKPRR